MVHPLGEEDGQYAKRQYGFEYDRFLMFLKKFMMILRKMYLIVVNVLIINGIKMMDTYKTEYPDLYSGIIPKIQMMNILLM